MVCLVLLSLYKRSIVTIPQHNIHLGTVLHTQLHRTTSIYCHPDDWCQVLTITKLMVWIHNYSRTLVNQWFVTIAHLICHYLYVTTRSTELYAAIHIKILKSLAKLEEGWHMILLECSSTKQWMYKQGCNGVTQAHIPLPMVPIVIPVHAWPQFLLGNISHPVRMS